MKPRPDRLNRSLLTVLALLVTAAGVYGLLRSFGAFGDDSKEARVLPNSVTDWVRDNDSWFWIVAAIVGVLISLLALRWLWSQLHAPRAGSLDFTSRSEHGGTRLLAGGAEQALANDIESYDGVAAASTRLLSAGRQPELNVRVDLADDADIGGVRRRIEEHAFARLRQALETDDVRGHVRLRLAEPTGGARVS